MNSVISLDAHKRLLSATTKPEATEVRRISDVVKHEISKLPPGTISRELFMTHKLRELTKLANTQQTTIDELELLAITDPLTKLLNRR